MSQTTIPPEDAASILEAHKSQYQDRLIAWAVMRAAEADLNFWDFPDELRAAWLEREDACRNMPLRGLAL